jgi:hypothetical protein
LFLKAIDVARSFRVSMMPLFFKYLQDHQRKRP